MWAPPSWGGDSEGGRCHLGEETHEGRVPPSWGGTHEGRASGSLFMFIYGFNGTGRAPHR